MYETSHESESCVIGAVTVGVFKLIASVLCSQSVLEVGTISQSFDFFVTSRMRFAGKFYQKYLFFAYVRAGKAAQGPPVNYKPHKSQFAIPCLVSNVNQSMFRIFFTSELSVL